MIYDLEHRIHAGSDTRPASVTRDVRVMYRITFHVH